MNQRITEHTLHRVEKLCGADQETIARRLDELDREWDFERTIQTGATLQILLGLALGMWVHRLGYVWSALIAGFLLAHALVGWAPPLPVLRRLGFRTEMEIEEERNALRLLRGDFKPTSNPQEAFAQAHMDHS